ncbi:hypothetical protein [Enterobacter sp. 22466]|uniref:hypothetical protein n=1 Tax=Enterobacter sp. 22466 TaxID=3453924 RepID=UPI003F8605FA
MHELFVLVLSTCANLSNMSGCSLEVVNLNTEKEPVNVFYSRKDCEESMKGIMLNHALYHEISGREPFMAKCEQIFISQSLMK